MRKTRREQIKANLGKGNGNKQGQGKRPGNTSLTAPLTTPQARHMAGAEARSEYGPTINAIKGQREGSRQREKEIPQWFNALGDQANQAAAATDASYGQADAALLAHMQAAQNAAQATQGQIAAGNASTAALTGADPSLFAPIQAEGAAAASQRDLTSAALAAPIAQAGASEAGYLRATGLNARREGIQQRQLESKRGQKIKEDLTAARKERGQKAVGNFGDIRDKERTYGIQRAAFKLNKGEAAQDAAQAAAAQGLDEAQFSETQRHDRATEANAAADNAVGGLTPTQKRDASREKHNAMTAAATLYEAAGEPKWSDKQWTVFVQRVAMEDGIDYTAAKKAVERLRKQNAPNVFKEEPPF